MLDALAWPAVGLILGLVLIFVFRRPLVAKIERISQASREGITFERPQEPESSPKSTQSFDELMRHPVSATILEREKFVSGQLGKLPLKTDAERISALVRAVAAVNIELEYTRISHIIFGSQVELLVQLAGTRQRLPLERAQATYHSAKERWPALYAERDFAAWLGYLESSSLLVRDGDSLDITQYGSDFLKFLVDARLAHERYG